jgi:hypothetical protein
MAKRPREEDHLSPNNNDDDPSERSSSSQGTSTSATQTAASKENLVWSSFIKAHHQRIRDSVKADHAGDASAAWRAVLEDQAALAQYATSMHHLATKYWDAPSSPAPRTDGTTKGKGDQPTESDVAGGGAAEEDSNVAAASKFRYDDRIEYAISCVQEYFVGPVAGSGGGDEGKGSTFLPHAVAAPLKQAKREYYQSHQAPMPEDAQLRWVRQWLCDRTARPAAALPSPSSSHDNVPPPSALSIAKESFLRLYFPDAQSSMSSSSSSSPICIRMLDVGSCYAPFEGKSISLWSHVESNSTATAVAPFPERHIFHSAEGLQSTTLTLDVVSVDLAPYPDSNVWPCDWLGVTVRQQQPQDTKKAHATAKDQLCFDARCALRGEQGDSATPPTSFCGRPHVLGINAASFDVISFSLVLSYMPTPQMRFEACRKAHAVLRDLGLLVVISTRTQGPRQASWVNDWITAIESIGFVRVHKHIRCRLIGMTFQKKMSVGAEAAAAPTEEMVAKMAAKMVITADTI